MYEDVKVIPNETRQDIQVFIEPWGMGYTLPPGSRLKVVVKGEQPGDLESEDTPSCITVWGWSGSTYSIYLDDTLIEDMPIVFPETPGGMSMKAFTGMVFGEGTTSRATEKPTGNKK